MTSQVEIPPLTGLIHFFSGKRRVNDKQYRSRSVGFFRSQLTWICTVCKDRAYLDSAGLGLISFSCMPSRHKLKHEEQGMRMRKHSARHYHPRSSVNVGDHSGKYFSRSRFKFFHHFPRICSLPFHAACLCMKCQTTFCLC